MKRMLPIFLLLCILLSGCSSSASTSAINAAYQNGYEEGQADLDGYIPEDDAIDYVFEYFRDEVEERALDNLISNDLDALLDEVITDENWDSVAEYLEEDIPP